MFLFLNNKKYKNYTKIKLSPSNLKKIALEHSPYPKFLEYFIEIDFKKYYFLNTFPLFQTTRTF